MRSHNIVHLDVGPGPGEPAELLRCDHGDGSVSFRLIDTDVTLWLTGTAENFDLFADVIDALAARIRSEEPAP